MIGYQRVAWDPRRGRQRSASLSSLAGSNNGRAAGTPSEKLSHWAQDSCRGRQRCISLPYAERAQVSTMAGVPCDRMLRSNCPPAPRQSCARPLRSASSDRISTQSGRSGNSSCHTPRPNCSSSRSSFSPPCTGQQIQGRQSSSLPPPGQNDQIVSEAGNGVAIIPHELLTVPPAQPRSPAVAEAAHSEAEAEEGTVDTKTATAAANACVGSVTMEEFTPADVANWLRSMANCIPNKVLAEIRACVVAQQINGRAFANIIENCRTEVLSVDGLSPLHMNRVRRAWHLDCESLGDSEPQDVQESQQEVLPQQPGPTENRTVLQPQQPVVQESDLQQLVATHQADHEIGIPGGLAPLSAAELVAATVEHLAAWAGFDQRDALAELHAVLPPAVLSGVSKAIPRQAEKNASEEFPFMLDSQLRDKPARDGIQGGPHCLAGSFSEDAPFSNIGRLERHVCTGGAF